MAVKRYLAFAGVNYSKEGGMANFVGDFASIEEAWGEMTSRKGDFDWFHVYDVEERIIVSKGSR
jgi:hypothetical protein